MKHVRIILSLVIILLTFNSCDVLQQATELHTLTKCKFRLNTVENITLAGVDVQHKKSFSDLTFQDAAKLTQALLSGDLPLSFILNIEAKNPNNKPAAMNKFDWILFIDDIEMTRGSTTKRIEIPANNGTGILPLYLGFDLLDILSGESRDAVLNFGFNLAGAGNAPTRITVKAKPTIYVSGQSIDYPGYITINNDFSSSNGTTPTQRGTIRF